VSAAPLTSQTFAGYVGETFEIQAPDVEPFDAVLVSCTESTKEVPDEWKERIGRTPFSLLFVAASHEHAAEQQIFSVSHPDAGDHAIFLVALGPASDGSGMRYEAVFS
jgi:hypothetical protein